MKKIIINADDFGIDLDRDLGIIFGVLIKAISSISVIVTNKFNRKRLVKMIQLMKKFNPNVSIGLHVNLTDHKLLTCYLKEICEEYHHNKHPKLVFWESAVINAINIEKIKEEIRMQFSLFYDLFGFVPSHVDGHNHCHIASPLIYQCLERLADQYNVKYIRWPDEEIINEDINEVIRLSKLMSRFILADQFRKYRNIQRLKAEDMVNLVKTMRTNPLSDIYLYKLSCSSIAEKYNKRTFIGTVYGHIRTFDFLKGKVVKTQSDRHI